MSLGNYMNLELAKTPAQNVPNDCFMTALGGVLMVWRQEHRLQSKGNGMARDHLQGSGKKSDTPLTINTARLIMYDIVYVCVHVYV